MRTDSNTVSSLPLSAVSTKPTSLKIASENGVSFASDFHRAKEALNGTQLDSDQRQATSESIGSSASKTSQALPIGASTLAQSGDADPVVAVATNAANNGKVLPSNPSALSAITSSELSPELTSTKLGGSPVITSLSQPQTVGLQSVHPSNGEALLSKDGTQQGVSLAVKSVTTAPISTEDSAVLEKSLLGVSGLKTLASLQGTTEKTSLSDVSKSGVTDRISSSSNVLEAASLVEAPNTPKLEVPASASDNLVMADIQPQSQPISKLTNSLESENTKVTDAFNESPPLLPEGEVPPSTLENSLYSSASSVTTTLSDPDTPTLSPASSVLPAENSVPSPSPISVSSTKTALGVAGEASPFALAAGETASLTHNNVVQPSALSSLGKLNNYSVKEKTADVIALDPLTELALPSEEGELSWVLSQMGAPMTKLASTKADVAVDVTKVATAYTAGVSVAGMGKANAADAVLLSSNFDSQSDESVFNGTDLVLEGEEVFVNEPIELRKKEHEVLLGKMSAQNDAIMADSRTSEDKSVGGLGSSIQNNVNRLAAAGPAFMASAQPNNLAMSVPPGHPGWAGEMTQKVAWVAREGGHTAHIRLDPPELGSLTVKVSVDNDANTQVSFIAATPQARDLLEAQMGRLRDMLAQQGMDLSRADVDVSQRDTSGAQDNEQYRGDNERSAFIKGGDLGDDESIPTNVSYVSATGVDYYA